MKLISLKTIVIVFGFLTFVSCNENSIPNALKHRDKIKSIDLLNQKLKSLPPEFVQLQNLEYIYLNNNDLKQFPEVLTKLKKLKQLNLSNNQIDSLPVSISELTNLESLSLINNPIKNFPDALLKLPNLKYLNLAGTALTWNDKERILKALPNVSLYFDLESQLYDINYCYSKAVDAYNFHNFNMAEHYCNITLNLIFTTKVNFSEPVLLAGAVQLNLNKKDVACNLWRQALQMGNTKANDFLNNYCK